MSLDALCERFHIPDVVYPELPGRNDRIRNNLVCKIGVYSRFFDFANYRVPHSQFLVDILEYFQINLSQLSVITIAKVFHFEILCRIYGFVPTVEMDFFAFINHADPTKENVNVQGDGNDDVNEEDNDAVKADQNKKGDHVVHVGGIDIVIYDEA
nr:putative transposase (putative), gypsy type [Tanacetum cinerariifolium]